jgi:hypothetical protein
MSSILTADACIKAAIADRLDIIEMGYWGMCFKLAVGCDSLECRDRPKTAQIGG